MNIADTTLKMTFGILEHHGKAFGKDKELQKIWGAGTKAWRNGDEDGMRGALERFAEWDKRQTEEGR